MVKKHRFGAQSGMASANNIERLREEMGWKRPQLAERMNTSPQQIERLEKGMRRLTQDWIDRAADALGVPATAIISNDTDLPQPNGKPFKMEGASLERMREDLPIYGTALGAPKIVDEESIEQTTLNRAEIVGYAKRPVILNGRADAYGLYVQGHSMRPRFEEGDMILAETKRPARIGDDVVVYLRPMGDDDDGAFARGVLVKRLARKTASYVELEQFDPKISFRIPAEQVLRIDRVLTLLDLIG
jgi:transcriptional regulator with XRE-family HTH domain